MSARTASGTDPAINNPASRSKPEVKRLFGTEAYLTMVDFARPSQVLFTLVDLSRTSFLGTNMRGVRFFGVNWAIFGEGRKGLYDKGYIVSSPQGEFRDANLARLEEAYRNVSAALEGNRSFADAADFYVAEMDAQRAQLPWFRRYFCSVPAL